MSDINYILKTLDSNNNIKKIGEGASGIVYFDKKFPNYVFKISKKKKTCSDFGKEYNIYKILNNFNIDQPLFKLLKLYDFKQTNEKCIMELSRSVNPLNSNLNYTIHPLFGENNTDFFIEGRGRFLGLNQLIDLNIINEKNIEEYISQLAILISNLHFQVKNDGYDLELFISSDNSNSNRKNNNRNIIIFLGDFDLTEFITEFNDNTIKRLIWSLNAVPYFPTPFQHNLYKIFSNNYIKNAKKYDFEYIASHILQKYEESSFNNNGKQFKRNI
jgi:hypothetical protein